MMEEPPLLEFDFSDERPKLKADADTLIALEILAWRLLPRVSQEAWRSFLQRPTLVALKYSVVSHLLRLPPLPPLSSALPLLVSCLFFLLLGTRLVDLGVTAVFSLLAYLWYAECPEGEVSTDRSHR